MISEKQQKAIDTFVKIFKGSHQAVSNNQYKIFYSKKTLIAYAIVEVSHNLIYKAYPLIINTHTLSGLVKKRLSPVVIWCCDDGIIYGKVTQMYGQIKWGKDIPHSVNTDLMCYYEKQKAFKYIKFI